MGVKTTPFTAIYDSFFTRVSDDLYSVYMTELDTMRDLQDILLTSIPRFELPRFDIFDYEEGYFDNLGTYSGVETDNYEGPVTGWVGGFFNADLSIEEINILALCMMVTWLERQIATTDNTRMKFSGSDFHMGSQANHMAKLKNVLEIQKQDCVHLQRVYKRRIRVDGQIYSSLGTIMSPPNHGDLSDY